jgi:DNA-binding NtrC family response regulator
MVKDSTPLRVLVVDDEPLMCWALAEALGDRGDIVIKAGDGATAFRAVTYASYPIDVVLLDYRLPDSNGLALLSTVRRLSPDSQVIVMSAYCTPEVTKEALALGAYCVVSKPINMHDVSDLVSEAASSRQTGAATVFGLNRDQIRSLIERFELERSSS